MKQLILRWCIVAAACTTVGVICTATPCAEVARWDSLHTRIVLDNGIVRREISVAGGGVSTMSLRMSGAGAEYVTGRSPEFSFEMNGSWVDGRKGWEVAAVRAASDVRGGGGAAVTIRGTGETAGAMEVELTWLLYPNLPVVRKRLAVKNTGTGDIRLESLDMEHLFLAWGDTHAWVMANYARDRHLGPFAGDWNDPAVVVHDIPGRRGIVLGNEAPGVVKRTSAFTDGRSVTIGLTRPDGDFPFRKWLRPGERWESPWCFIVPYSESGDPRSAINGPVSDFVRRHMGIRLAEIGKKPSFVYNTWNPFRKDISEGLIRELAEAAADCGVEEFVIDDGWQVNRGDWKIDRKKFPNGLKPVFDHIVSLGMKPGLWISLASAERSSRVFREHTEWFVRDASGKPVCLHSPISEEVTACMATGWYDYIKSVILALVRGHGLAYVKLDLTIVTSAYVYDRGMSGCCATDHPLHRDREESFLAEYERCMALFDELHREAPDLFIDCTFETWGELQLIDFALVKHAEGDWLSNIEEPMPFGGLRARNLAWSRSPVIPAGALVIGNLTLDDPGRETALLSLAGTLPIMLGDPRKIPEPERRKLKRLADQLRGMERKHGYFLFRQDLPGFGEPNEGCWDGWSRINTDTKSGGIVGVFRQGGVEAARTVAIPGLDPEGTYTVRSGSGGALAEKFTGRELAEKGFVVRLPLPYDAALFDVERVK